MAAVSFEQTEMSALKEGVVQEWGAEKSCLLFLHLPCEACIHGCIELSGDCSWEACSAIGRKLVRTSSN